MRIPQYFASLTSILSSLRLDKVQDKCTAATLRDVFKFENTTIIDVTRLAPGTSFPVPGSCQDIADSGDVPICRVYLLVNTSATSKVHLEVWLPDAWFGRLLGLGNGGLGGCIDYPNLAYGTSFHFATIASDNGHDGNNGSVFLNHPEVINDFAFRAVHTEAEVGKTLVKAYYGRPPHKSYFLGCSTGGRQGIKSAELYPDDFDGIIAGAPAVDFNHLMDWTLNLTLAVGAPNPDTSESFIPPSLWSVISQEILRQCDELDGVIDGIITEPDDCQFYPEILICTSQNPTGCLTLPQINALHKIYEPLYGIEGEILYPRYDPGAESNVAAQQCFGGAIPSTSNGWFKYAVFNDSEFDITNFTLNDAYIVDSINPGGISTWTGNLTSFKERGGKLITYHGRGDPLIASGISKRLYNHISQTMGLASLDSFYRLFMVPGMGHCARGPGSWAIGQYGPWSNVANDSSHNVLLATVEWVEGGYAPANITGTIPGNATADRVHCRFPLRSVWQDDKWICVE